jgi:hypothetical protein
MAELRAAFIFRAPGANPADRTIRTGALEEKALVPVPNADAAAEVASEMLGDGLDLIELYGGLGITAAAAVFEATAGTVPVGVVGVEEDPPTGNCAVIFEESGADPTVDRYVHEHADGRITIVAAPEPAAVPAIAVQLVDEGAERVELCGGLGIVPAAATIAAVAGRARVVPVLFGFESLPLVARYRTRFEDALARRSG